MWQRDRFLLLRLERQTPSTHHRVSPQDAASWRWIGMNALELPSDPDVDIPFSAYGQSLVARGCEGVVALGPTGEIAGWLWAHIGPSDEQAGAGFLRIPQGVRIFHDLKVHPDLRGRGLGHQLLVEFARRSQVDPATPSVAIVEPKNAPSLACLTWAGFDVVASVHATRIAGRRLTTPIPRVSA